MSKVEFQLSCTIVKHFFAGVNVKNIFCFANPGDNVNVPGTYCGKQKTRWGCYAFKHVLYLLLSLYFTLRAGEFSSTLATDVDEWSLRADNARSRRCEPERTCLSDVRRRTLVAALLWRWSLSPQVSHDRVFPHNLRMAAFVTGYCHGSFLGGEDSVQT